MTLVFISPVYADDKAAKFIMSTLQYFFFAPFKVTDSGTNWGLLDSLQIDSTSYDTGKLSFDEQIGNAPGDFFRAV